MWTWILIFCIIAGLSFWFDAAYQRRKIARLLEEFMRVDSDVQRINERLRLIKKMDEWLEAQ